MFLTRGKIAPNKLFKLKLQVFSHVKPSRGSNAKKKKKKKNNKILDELLTHENK